MIFFKNLGASLLSVVHKLKFGNMKTVISILSAELEIHKCQVDPKPFTQLLWILTLFERIEMYRKTQLKYQFAICGLSKISITSFANLVKVFWPFHI